MKSISWPLLCVNIWTSSFQKRQFTNLSQFSIRCLVCETLLAGQQAAQHHAVTTGHTNFGEVWTGLKVWWFGIFPVPPGFRIRTDKSRTWRIPDRAKMWLPNRSGVKVHSRGMLRPTTEWTKSKRKMNAVRSWNSNFANTCAKNWKCDLKSPYHFQVSSLPRKLTEKRYVRI